MADITVSVGDVVHVLDASLETTTAAKTTTPSIADLLAQSRAAHMRVHHASGSVNRDGTLKTAPDRAAKTLALTDAMSARQAAESADPSHSDPAWSEDAALNRGVSSVDLLAFFQSSLTS